MYTFTTDSRTTIKIIVATWNREMISNFWGNSAQSPHLTANLMLIRRTVKNQLHHVALLPIPYSMVSTKTPTVLLCERFITHLLINATPSVQSPQEHDKTRDFIKCHLKYLSSGKSQEKICNNYIFVSRKLFKCLV